MLTVYGAEACKDCLATKKIFAQWGISYEYVDFTKTTANMRRFFAIRDHADLYAPLRDGGKGGIGIPLFEKDGQLSFDINDALRWEGYSPIPAAEYDALAAEMRRFIELKNQIDANFADESAGFSGCGDGGCH